MYLSDLVLRQFAAGVLHSFCVAPVLFPVIQIGLSRIPSKIAQCVVLGIWVRIVARLHAVWSRADEGFENEVMNLPPLWSGIQAHNGPVAFLEYLRGQFSPHDHRPGDELHPFLGIGPVFAFGRSVRPDRSVRACLIANVLRNVPILDSLSVTRHAHLPQGECVAGEEATPSRLKTL